MIESREPVKRHHSKHEKTGLQKTNPGETRLVQAGDQLRHVKDRKCGKPDGSLLDYVIEGWREPNGVAG